MKEQISKQEIQKKVEGEKVINSFEKDYKPKLQGEPKDSLDYFMMDSFLKNQKQAHTELPESVTILVKPEVETNLFNINKVEIPHVGKGYEVNGVYILETNCEEPVDNACCLSLIRVILDKENKKILFSGTNISELTESKLGKYIYTNYIVGKGDWKVEIQDRFVFGNCYPGIFPDKKCFTDKNWKLERDVKTDINFSEQKEEKEITDAEDKINPKPFTY